MLTAPPGDSLKHAPLETSLGAHAGAVAFVLLLPTVTTWFYFVLLSGQPQMQTMYAASKVVQFSFPLIWVWGVQRRRPKLMRPAGRSIGWGLAFGIAAVAVGLAAYFGYFKSSHVLARAPELIGTKVRGMGLTSPVRYLFFAVFVAVPHALLEEYYWRWFAFGQLRRVTSFTVATAVSSLGFMAHHVIVVHELLHGPWLVTVFFSLCVALGGFVWSGLYQRFGSLYGPWLSHLIVDLGIMFIGFDLVRWD